MNKEVKQCVVLVDYYKPRHLKHSTSGRYRVAATSKEEAVDLVQKAIKFGSAQFYYFDTNPKPQLILPYKSVKEEISAPSPKGLTSFLVDVISATDPADKRIARANHIKEIKAQLATQ